MLFLILLWVACAYYGFSCCLHCLKYKFQFEDNTHTHNSQFAQGNQGKNKQRKRERGGRRGGEKENETGLAHMVWPNIFSSRKNTYIFHFKYNLFWHKDPVNTFPKKLNTIDRYIFCLFYFLHFSILFFSFLFFRSKKFWKKCPPSSVYFFCQLLLLLLLLSTYTVSNTHTYKHQQYTQTATGMRNICAYTVNKILIYIQEYKHTHR